MNNTTSAHNGGAPEGVLLAEVLPFLMRLGRSGRLVGGRPGDTPLEVWIEDGRVVEAAWGSLRGLSALEMSGVFLPRANFVFSEGVRCDAPMLAMTAEDLTRTLDEGSREDPALARLVPGLDSVPIRIAPAGAAVQDESTLEGLDGRRSVGELVQRGRPLLVVRSLAALAEQGVITFVPATAPRDVEPLQVPAPRPQPAVETPEPAAQMPEPAADMPEPAAETPRGAAADAAGAAGTGRAEDHAAAAYGRQDAPVHQVGAVTRPEPKWTTLRRAAVDAARAAGRGRAAAPDWGRMSRLPRTIVGLVVLGLFAIAAIGIAVFSARPSSTIVILDSATAVPSPPLSEAAVPLSRPTPTAAAAPQPAPAPATPEPTPTPTPTPTVRLLLDELFTDGARGWPNVVNSTAWSDALGYHLVPRIAGQHVAVVAPLAQDLSNVLVAGTFRKTGGPAGGGYGLVLRDQGPALDGNSQGGRFYVFEVGDRGEVGIWRRDEDHWLELLPWTPSEAVHPGAAANRLQVRAVGSAFTFMVNDMQVAQASDTGLAWGAVGVFTGGDGNQVLLQRFMVASI